VDSIIDTQVKNKRRKHSEAAERAGVKFVPLVASSLGKLHEDFRVFL
jgi:hypothetical protein